MLPLFGKPIMLPCFRQVCYVALFGGPIMSTYFSKGHYVALFGRPIRFLISLAQYVALVRHIIVALFYQAYRIALFKQAHYIALFWQAYYVALCWHAYFVALFWQPYFVASFWQAYLCWLTYFVLFTSMLVMLPPFSWPSYCLMLMGILFCLIGEPSRLYSVGGPFCCLNSVGLFCCLIWQAY